MRFLSYLLVLIIFLQSISASANTTTKGLDTQNLSLQKSYLQTINCRSPKRLSGMISIALKRSDNYTTKASNAVMFEEIMMNNPSCFIQALNNLPAKQCLQVEETFINETFFYPRNEIKSALMSASNYTNSCIAS